MYSDNNATATTPSSLFYITLSYLSLQKKKKSLPYTTTSADLYVT